MEQDGKRVILPWNEYQGLLKDGEALKEAREELKRDCEERGLYVETKVVVYSGGFYDGPLQDINPHLNIASKDEVLKAAQEEIDRLSVAAKDLLDENRRLRGRNLWQRIINKEN